MRSKLTARRLLADNHHGHDRIQTDGSPRGNVRVNIVLKSRRFTSDGGIVLVLFGLGAALRAAVLSSISSRPWWSRPLLDARVYHDAGESISRGNLLLPDTFPLSPLYAYLVGGVYAVGGVNPWLVRVVQMLLGAAIPVVLFFAGRAIGGRRAGLAAGLLALGCGPLVAHETDLTPSVFSAGAMALLLLLFLPGVRGRVPAFLRGAVATLLVYLRPNMLLFLPVPFLFSTLKAERKGFAAAAFLAGALAVAVPFVVPDLLGGRPVHPVARHGGVNFYIGNNPSATGTWAPPLPGAREVESINISPPPEGGWVGGALRFWRESPGRALALTGRKILLVLNRFEFPVNLPFPVVREEVRPLGLLPIGWGILMPLIAFGWLARPGAEPLERLCRWTLVAGLASIVPFFVADRFRICLYPPAIVLAGVGLARLSLPPRGKAILLPLSAAFIAGLIALLPPPVSMENERMIYRYNSALNLLKSGREIEADALLATVTAGSQRAEALFIRSTIALRRGDPSGAVRQLAEAAALRPGDPLILYNMVLAQERSGGDSGPWRERYRLVTGKDNLPPLRPAAR
jgi:4-amino-4-deoxy-L-arabinose transferase-like glycosyltransferase